MEQTKPTPQNDTSRSVKLPESIRIPEGDVLLRRIGGPDGINYLIGAVKRGRLYCVSAKDAAKLIAAVPGQFEPISKAHRTLIEAASKRSKDETRDQNKVG